MFRTHSFLRDVGKLNSESEREQLGLDLMSEDELVEDEFAVGPPPPAPGENLAGSKSKLPESACPKRPGAERRRNAVESMGTRVRVASSGLTPATSSGLTPAINKLRLKQRNAPAPAPAPSSDMVL